MPLTQGDIPKIVELIVRQLPVTSNNTASNSTQALAAGTQHIPSSLTSNQAPPIIPATSSTPGAGGSTSLTLTGILGITPTALPPLENSSTGDGGDIAVASVQPPLTVPGK